MPQTAVDENKDHQLVAANGTKLDISHRVLLNLAIGDKSILHPFYVCNWIKHSIIDWDAMKKYNIVLANGEFFVDNKASQKLCGAEMSVIWDDNTDPERTKRIFWADGQANQTKWTMSNRYWNGHGMFDTETQSRRDGTATITREHREGNATMRIFYRGALMGMMIGRLRALLHEAMIICIRNSIPNLRTYLLENIETIVTIEDAVR